MGVGIVPYLHQADPSERIWTEYEVVMGPELFPALLRPWGRLVCQVVVDENDLKSRLLSHLQLDVLHYFFLFLIIIKK